MELRERLRGMLQELSGLWAATEFDVRSFRASVPSLMCEVRVAEYLAHLSCHESCAGPPKPLATTYPTLDTAPGVFQSVGSPAEADARFVMPSTRLCFSSQQAPAAPPEQSSLELFRAPFLPFLCHLPIDHAILGMAHGLVLKWRHQRGLCEAKPPLAHGLSTDTVLLCMCHLLQEDTQCTVQALCRLRQVSRWFWVPQRSLEWLSPVDCAVTMLLWDSVGPELLAQAGFCSQHTFGYWEGLAFRLNRDEARSATRIMRFNATQRRSHHDQCPFNATGEHCGNEACRFSHDADEEGTRRRRLGAVSYTHLTLPTKRIV
eukprot:TRINITY_DN7206_c0_g1_i1.p1 TRINITY_DN7206_c0_g1~~TRINITY_DN7206_c0_g1_i1.p1  ORF type:complete len:318 (+),score=54.91 TRINITY_DN7206_c0_g1_i1:199-1152(+)